MAPPLITFTSDFGIQSRGVGSMEVAAYEICPEAKVVHLQHGLPDYDISSGALALESVCRLKGGIHVCVVDPGVGTHRKPIAIQTKRGDVLIGPDNGVLLPTARILGGIEKVVHLTNKKYMRESISNIFHGRDIFTPAAAHIASGVSIDDLGKDLQESDLVPAPYEDAKSVDERIDATVVFINKYGSIILNILHADFDVFGPKKGQEVLFSIADKTVKAIYCDTFGEVKKGETVILKDDYARVEMAINCGNFAEKHSISIGDRINID